MKENSGGEPRKGIWSWILPAIRLLVAALILYALLQVVAISNVARAFAAARVEYIALAGVLTIANLGLQALKWKYFVRRVNPSISNFETIASLLFGITLGIVTPGQLGEFGGRALRHHSISPAMIIGLTLVDKLQMLLVMGLAAVVSYGSLLALPLWQNMLLTIVTWGLLLYIFFRPSLLGRLLSLIRISAFRKPWAEDFRLSLGFFDAKTLRFALLASISFYAVVYVQMYLLLNAFSAVQMWQAFVGFSAMMFFKAVTPISFGDLGIREASAVYFYWLLGIPETTALNASLLLFVINIAVPALLGLLFIPRFPRARPTNAANNKPVEPEA